MNVSIQKDEKIVTISELGLDITIKPTHLIHQIMDDDGRKMLRNMMSETLDGILIQLVNDYSSLTTEKKESTREGKVLIKSLYMFATFLRQVMPICFSFDLSEYYDKTSKINKEVIDWAYYTIKYNDAYGYKEPIKANINI